VQALAEAEDGSLWVATPQGLQRWNGSVFLPGPPFAEPKPLVSALLVDTQGVLWAADQLGIVYRLREGVMQPVPEASLPGAPIYSLSMDRHGTLWVASMGKGLLRLVNGRRFVLDTSNGLVSSGVFSLLEDSEGSIWLGMGSRGLHRLKDAPFTPYGPAEGLGHEMVSAVHQARDGSIWISTLGGGVSRWKDGRMMTWSVKEGLLDEHVFGIAEGRDGNLWFATHKGPFRWREGTFSHMMEPALAPRGSFGQVVHEDEHGTLWASTQEGLVRWDGRQFLPVAPEDKVLGATIRVLQRRAAGGFWIGTEGGGLAWYDEGRSFTLSSQGSPITGDVRGLHEEGQTLWIGTTDGLFRWKDGHFVRLSRAQGLFDDVVFQILPDGQGNLWMTCNKGIFRVSQRELEAVADQRLERVISYAYGRDEGLRAEECNALGGPAGIRAHDGRLWFPTIRGAVVYDPRHEKTPTALPPVRIEELWVDRQPLPASEWSRIPPGEGRVEIHYTTPSLSGAERVRFRYKLQGIDPDWVEAGAQRAAYYTRLPPGTHRFLVEAFMEGRPAARGAELVFRLQPRFFETIFFRVGLGLALMLTVAGAVWLRLHQSRQREVQLQARVDERTTELALRLQQLQATQEKLAHAEKLVAVGTLAAGVGHEINNPLAYILSNLRYLSSELRAVAKPEGDREHWQEMEEAVGDALHGAERVRNIVQALKMLARVQTGPSSRVDPHPVLEHALEVVAPRLSGRARISRDFSLRQPVLGDEGRLGQVFLHLLDNAAQAIPQGHPESNEIHLKTYRSEQGRAVIEVRDTGCGIAPEIVPRIFEPFFTTRETGEGMGLGLAICHASIQSMGGEIQVHSEQGLGSTFRLLLPADPLS
jgi:signal transduction histidine kinase/ligand-binding sensor domain-containing protein